MNKAQQRQRTSEVGKYKSRAKRRTKRSRKPIANRIKKQARK